MKEKRMTEITISSTDGIIELTTPDHGMGEQAICIPFEQVPIVIAWMQEMLETPNE